MMVIPIVGSVPQVITNKDGLYTGDLRGYFKIVSDPTIARGVHNPYHGIRHTLHVPVMCASALLYYKETGKPVDLMLARELLIAALFHDFDHTGRGGNDDINIELAVRGFRKHILPYDYNSFDRIVRLIRSTQYPHVIPAHKLDLSGQILRDADLSQGLSTAWIEQVIYGLALEQGQSIRAVASMQQEFISNLSFSTDWAKFMFADKLKEKIEEVKEYYDLFN